MSSKLLAHEQILTMLAAAPPRIAACTADLPQAQLHTAPKPDAWSVREILAHLRACADMWGDGIQTIIAHDHPTIRAVNPTTWIDQTDYREQPFLESLQAFTTQRHGLLAVLEPLAPDDWSRAAIIIGAGKPIERTIHGYAHWLAHHERLHLKQIERMTKMPHPQQ